MEFRILGPIEAIDSGLPVDLGAPKERALLARLLIDANEVVSTDRLLEDLWPEGVPSGGPRSLHVHVARLRSTLERGGDARIETVAPGYVLNVDPDAVDVTKFEHLQRSARGKINTNPRHAAATLRRALGLWRGPALADFTYEAFAEAEIRRLTELRLTATEELNEADLALGNGAEITSRLEKLVTEHPLRERLRCQLMVALYQAGRQADALRAFQDACDALVEGLGLEPSQELRDLEERILLHDTALLGSGTVAGAGSAIPLRLSSFVGRWRDEAAVRRLLDERRLVTITGVGGVGKTSLAVEAGRDAASDYADGVYLVRLDGLNLDELVPDEIVQALGRRVTEGQSAATILRDYLKDRQALLVLDNCEHLLGGVATTSRELLQACPELRILATSREPLGVEGEIVYRLDPLPVPAGDAGLDETRRAPAAQLFLDRAAASRPEFVLDAGNRASVAHICRSVDGIPLAIELATARLGSMSCDELAGHMGRQIDILTGGQRTALPRHQTLEAAMDVSYGLLSESDRALMRRTGVFRGGFAAGDAAAVCGEQDSEIDALDGLSRLVAASLVVADERDGATRYRQLEPVRQYGAERLSEAGEDRAVRRRHAERFAEKATAIDELTQEAETDLALEIGHRDRENFREALRWAIDAGEAGTSLALAVGLAPVWAKAGPKSEGHAWLEAALALSPEAATVERFRALDYDIQFGIACNEPVDARLAEVDRLGDSLGGDEQKARALHLRALHAFSRGDLARAIELDEESLRLTEARDGSLSRDRLLLSECLIRVGRLDEAEQLLSEMIRRDEQQGRTREYGLIENLGMAFYTGGDLIEAERLVEDAVKGHGRQGSISSQMEAMSYLAWITIDLGKDGRTRLLAERALTMAREHSEVMIEANSLWVLGRLALREGDTDQARSHLAECLRIATRRRERIVVALALHACADLTDVEGDQERAVRLFGAADRHLRAIPHILPRTIATGYDRKLSDLRSSLGDAVWEAARLEGSALSLDDAISLAVKPGGTEAGNP